MIWFYIFLGGGIGSVFRYEISKWIHTTFPTAFPYGTFFVNIVGSFLIGCLMTYLLKHIPAKEEWRFLLVVGFCGGFTTFSTFSWESYQLFKTNQNQTALLYIILSIFVGLIATAIGAYLFKNSIK